MPTLRTASMGTEAGGRRYAREEDDFDHLHRQVQALRLGQGKSHRHTGLTSEARRKLHSATRPSRGGDSIGLTSTRGLRTMTPMERAKFRMHWRTPLTVERT